MERLAIDSIGPLPKSDEGYTHILTVVDCFTRWIELYPIKDVTADLAIKALLKHFGTFGQPSQIIYDNGFQFANESFSQLMLVAGIEEIPILPYSSEENGIVERTHREILKHLKGIIFHKNVITHWEEQLPQVKRILNSVKHTSTGVSPAELLFGNAIQLDPHILQPKFLNQDNIELTGKRLKVEKKMSTWIADMLKKTNNQQLP